MRLALEVKNQRNGHIRLFLDFLRHWYARPELVTLLARTRPESRLEREYLQLVLAQSDDEHESPRIQELASEAAKLNESADWARLLIVAKQLVQERGNVSDWTLLGYSLTQLNNNAEALAVVDKALELDPDLQSAWAVRSVALAGCDRFEEAVEAMTRAGPSHPDDPSYHSARAELLNHASRFDEALSESDRAIQLAPESHVAWSGRTDILLSAKRYDECVDCATRALALDPDSYELRLKRGRALVNLGRFSDSLSDFDNVLQSGIRDVRALWGRTVALAFLGTRELALESAWSALECAPADAFSNWLVAYLLVEDGRFGDALPFIRAAAESGDVDEGVLLQLSIRAGFGVNSFEQASADLLSLARIDDDDDGYEFLTTTTSLLTDVFLDASIDRWRQTASLLYTFYQEHGLELVLASSLVSAADALVKSPTRLGASGQWVALWREIASNDEIFDIPLRVLAALVRSRATEDPRVLLELSIEERRVAEEVLARTREQFETESL
jgi:tetratricopeptide (TPR) repeat protein